MPGTLRMTSAVPRAAHQRCSCASASARRLARAVDVALASPHWAVSAEVAVTSDGVELTVPPDADPPALVSLGALVQRILALAVAEGIEDIEALPVAGLAQGDRILRIAVRS